MNAVLDKSFIEPENIRKLCGKRRFTLAHECAHQILFQLDADDRKIACHKRPEVRKKGSRVLRTQEDWNEWQANSLGAAILMPQSESGSGDVVHQQQKASDMLWMAFYDKDQVKIDTFCGVFGVSRSAAAIRLEQLGYLNRKKDYEYRDPLEVWPMSRNIRVSEPSAEMQIKIIRAKDAIASQKPRIVRCPYCRHNSIIVFEDTRGHVQTKCKACGRETVFNVLEMRRLRRLQLYYSSLNG